MTLTQSHFELFAIPAAFELDVSQLAERYRELQRKLHPDRYANASEQERRIAVQKSAQVNDAYQTLKDPLNRARYLLQLNGVAFDDEKETQQDTVFLMEQMELREALDEVRTAADPLARLAGLMQSIKARQNEMEADLQHHLNKADQPSRLVAKQLVQKMQFFLRLQQQAEELEEQLVDSL